MDLSRQNCVNVDKYQIRFFFFQCYCFSFPINTKPHLSSFLHLIFHSSPTPFIPTLLPTPSFHPHSPSHTFLSSAISFPHIPFIPTFLLTPSLHPHSPSHTFLHSHSPSHTFLSSPLSFPHLPVIATLLPTPYFILTLLSTPSFHPHSPSDTFLSSPLSFPHLPFIPTLLPTPSCHPHSPSHTLLSSPLSFPHLPFIPTLLPTPSFEFSNYRRHIRLRGKGRICQCKNLKYSFWVFLAQLKQKHLMTSSDLNTPP